MSHPRVVKRAIRRLRADANRPHEALALMLMVAEICEQVEALRGEVPTTEVQVRAILLDAAAALEREYNPKPAERQPNHERASP